MGSLVMLSEALAMIGRQDDERVLSDPERIEARSDFRDLQVERRDLGVIGAVWKAGRDPGRRAIGRMRVEVVEPEKERTRSVLFDELEAAASDVAAETDEGRLFVAVISDATARFELRPFALGTAIVIESPRNLRLLPEDGRCDLCAGPKSVRLEMFRERAVFFREFEADVAANAVLKGIFPREDRCM